jgi:hypothetical protein
MDRKKKIIAITVVVLLSFLLAYDNFYKDLQQKKEAIEQARSLKVKTLKKYKTIVAQKSEIEKENGNNKALLAQVKNYVIQAKTPALAGADLQSMVQPIITARGGNVTRTNVKPGENIPPFQTITLEIDTTMPNVSVLNDVLYEIETRKPLLEIRKIDVRGINFMNPVDLFVNIEIAAITQ